MKNNPPAWLYRRTRLLSLLHLFRLAQPHSQMTKEEKECLGKHAKGKKNALEIGTYMGVTATLIASSLSENGKLYCIDPFESKNEKVNPGFKIAVRELKRRKLLQKTSFLQGFSNDKMIITRIPEQLDFILVDGDHSYQGLANDWNIVLKKLAHGGIVLLHDTTIPESEPYRQFGSVEFFNEVIKNNGDFERIETVYSMNVLLKK